MKHLLIVIMLMVSFTSYAVDLKAIDASEKQVKWMAQQCMSHIVKQYGTETTLFGKTYWHKNYIKERKRSHPGWANAMSTYRIEIIVLETTIAPWGEQSNKKQKYYCDFEARNNYSIVGSSPVATIDQDLQDILDAQ